MSDENGEKHVQTKLAATSHESFLDPPVPSSPHLRYSEWRREYHLQVRVPETVVAHPNDIISISQ
jgi:hypothetical protein